MTLDNRIGAAMSAAMIAVLMASSGCDRGGSDTDGFAFTGEHAEGAFTLMAAEPVVFTGKGNPMNFELLADTDFEKLGAGVSAQREAADAGWRQMSGGPDAFQIVADGGRNVLSMHPIAKGIELRQSTADLGPLPADTWLVASMRARADTANSLGLVISYIRDGVRIEAAEGHPGDGQWHDVRVAMPVPVNMTKNEYDCSVVYLGNANTDASIEWTQLRVESHDDSGQQANLVVNGDFEQYGFTQPPYPWKLDRWSSKGLAVIGGDAVLVAATGLANGTTAMSFTQPSESTNVRIFQPILTVDGGNTGTKLVVRAVGLASNKKELWLQLRCQKNGRDVLGQRKFAIHPGNGQWHEFSVELTVPSETVADTVYVDAIRRSFSDHETIIDSIRVEQIR